MAKRRRYKINNYKIGCSYEIKMGYMQRILGKLKLQLQFFLLLALYYVIGANFLIWSSQPQSTVSRKVCQTEGGNEHKSTSS